MTSRKLSDVAVNAIYARYEQGLSLRQVAAEFESSPSTVSRAFARLGLVVRPRCAVIGPAISKGTFWLVPLAGTRARGRMAMVDDKDYETVQPYRWHVGEQIHPNGGITGPYAWTYTRSDNGRESKVSMHFLLTGNLLTDHVNHDGLDNRRSNLRVATTAQNAFNSRPQIGTSSRYKGVTWHKQVRKWQAAIKVGGKNHYLGLFADERDAADAYDTAALEFFGEYAYLNQAGAA